MEQGSGAVRRAQDQARATTRTRRAMATIGAALVAALVVTTLPAQGAASRTSIPAQQASGVGRASSGYVIDDEPARRSWAAARNGRGTIFTVGFSAKRGEPVVVEGTLPLRVSAKASDSHLVAVTSAVCWSVDDKVRRTMTVARNIARGQTSLLQPGFVYAARVGGPQYCEIAIRTGRPRPTRYGASSNVILLGDGALLRVSRAGQGLGEDFHPDLASPVIRKGRSATVAAVPVSGLRPSFQMALSTYLTSCTSESGSHDDVTGRNACTYAMARRSASAVRVRVLLTQQGGGTCGRAVALVDQRVRIDRHLHHLPSWRGVASSLRSDCGTGLLRLVITTQSATPMLVHRSGTLLRVRAGG